MAWAAVGGAVVGGAMSMIGGNKAAKAAKKQQEAAIQAQREAQQYANLANQQNAAESQRMTQENMNWANSTNRENQLWGQDLNQQALADQTSANRLSGTNAMGTSMGFDANGNYTQTLGAGDQANMDALRGKTGEIVAGMGQQFGVNNDVMNALRGQLQPGYDQNAAAQRARAAAMGGGFGSGNANAIMEDQLGRNFNDMNQKAVLGGQQAWMEGQNLMNNQLGAMNQTRSGIQAGTATPDYWKQGNYAGVNAPTAQGWQSSIGQVGAMNPDSAIQSGQVAGAGVQQGWNQLGSQLGGLTSQGIDQWNKSGNTAAPTLSQQGAADFTNGWNSTNYG
jgi:hypothetical protein